MTRIAGATWLWAHEERPPAVDAVAAFAAKERLEDVFVSVPWAGPTLLTRALVGALRGLDVRVSCLGSGSDWVEQPAHAVAWMRRCEDSGLFDGVHLDVEPWARPEWPGDPRRLAEAYARMAVAVAAATPLPVELDVVPWLADEHKAAFDAAVSAVSGVTLMAYRDTADDILDYSHEARRRCASLEKPFRIGVETTQGRSGSFFGDRATLAREARRVADELGATASLIAVHDLEGWRSLVA